MNAPFLLLALTPSEWILLGPDGRLLRRERGPAASAAPELVELWTAEFPDERVGRLLLPDTGGNPARQARALAAAVRRIGVRLEGAWLWPASEAGRALLDDEVAASLLPHVSGPPGGPPDLLARRPLTLPPSWRTRRLRQIGAAAVGLLIAWGAVWQLQERARRSQRSAAAEAALELRDAATAAGLRHRRSVDEAAEILRAAAPPRSWLADFLHALSQATPTATVIDRLSVDEDRISLGYHAVPGAPVVSPEAALRPALIAGVQNAGIAVAPAALTGNDLQLVVTTNRPGSLTDPTPEAVGRVLARLPSPAAIDVLQRELAAHWKLTAVAADGSGTAPFQTRRLTLAAADLSRAAWPRLLALAAQLAALPGASVERVDAAGDGTESGGFARLSVTVVLRVRRN